MGVRLNKVLTELNIGFQTAADFLKNKPGLGEIRDDFSPNSKISDEQYEALVSQFKGDKFVKKEAEKIFAKKAKTDKKAPTKAEELLEDRQQYKPLGKINLDAIDKKQQSTAAVKPVEEKKVEKPKEETKKSDTVIKEKTKPVQEPDKKQPEVAQPSAQQTKAKQNDNKQKVEVVAKDGESNVFALKSETDRSPKLNVLGKIDLDALNQSTRPKKKSKEERRKEREEKAQGERRRRQRVSGERVDIEAAAKQNGNGNNGGKKKNGKGGQDNNANNQRNNNNNQAAAQQGGGKKKKNKNKQPVVPTFNTVFGNIFS